MKKHFGHSFAFDAPMVWNDLPDEVRSATTCLFQKKVKIVSLQKRHFQLSLYPIQRLRGTGLAMAMDR